MKLWGLVKGVYKGGKYLLSEVGNTIDITTNELDAWNKKQEKMKPAKDIIHLLKKSNFQCKLAEEQIPQKYSKSNEVFRTTPIIFDKCSEILSLGLDENYKHQAFILKLINMSYSMTDIENFDFRKMIEKEYPLKKLKKRGFSFSEKAKGHQATELSEIISFIYSFDGNKLELEAQKMIIQRDEMCVSMNKFINYLNSKRDTNILPLASSL